MYVIHRTPGFVLASFVSGEADRRYIILTEAFGRIEARARSVRLERSKLRYGLAPYTLGTYALVRGRMGWHIIGSHDEKNFFTFVGSHVLKRKALEHIATLLARMVTGEGRHEGLFATVTHGIDSLMAQQAEYTEAVELIVVLRIMYLLGYISIEQDGALLVPFVKDAAFDTSLLEAVPERRRDIIKAINNALTASHL